MSERPEIERTAQAMRDDLERVSGGRPCHWVAIHDITQRLGLDDHTGDIAVRWAIQQGWFVADSDPPHSVRLSAVTIAT